MSPSVRVPPRKSDPSVDTQVYRDGKVHVCARMCSTCVFHPGNLMQLGPGQLKAIIAGNLQNGAALTCHQTLPYSPGGGPGAVCRGFFDRYKDEIPALVLADNLGIIADQEPPSAD